MLLTANGHYSQLLYDGKQKCRALYPYRGTRSLLLVPVKKKVRIRQGGLFSPLLLNIILEVLANAITQEKEIKDIWIGKEEVIQCLFTHDMIIYVENTKALTKKILEASIAKLQDTK